MMRWHVAAMVITGALGMLFILGYLLATETIR